EVSFAKGQKYLTVVVDHDTGRLPYVVEGRSKKTVHGFFDLPGAERSRALTHISADGAEWIAAVVAQRAPDAKLCLDPFHVVKWAGDACQVPSGPVTEYLLPGPSVPLSVSAGDGTVSFDGERVRLEWNWKTEDAKAAAGSRTLALGDISAVEWLPAAGLENGHLRFLVHHSPTKAPAKYDPNAVELWGFKKDPLMAL